MSESEERLYGLMEIAERQQAVVQRVLNGLAAERDALAQERQKVAAEAAALEERVRDAVRATVTTALARVGEDGVAAVREATQPLLEDLAEMTEGVAEAETALQRVVSWVSWRLMARLLALIAGLVLLGWLSSTAIIWWDGGTVNRLRSEIATMRANHAAWVKKGMLDRLTRCDPGNRPCVAINPSAGAYGKSGDYRVLKGY